MQLLLLPEAEDDVRAAWFWYAQEAAGIETSYLSALERCLARIRVHPRGFPRVEGEIRRALVRPFPYGVVHLDAPDSVLVLACIHTSRSPHAWRRR